LHGPNDDGRDHAEENPGKQHFLPALELRHFVCCHEFYHYYRKHEDTKNQKNEYAIPVLKPGPSANARLVQQARIIARKNNLILDTTPPKLTTIYLQRKIPPSMKAVFT